MAAERRPILFIVGCPRSGTYLLSSMLNSGGRVAIPTETHFAPLFVPYLRLAGGPGGLRARRRLCRAIFTFLRIWLARSEEERDFSAVSRHSLLAVEDQCGAIAGSARGYEDLVRGLFGAYAELKGAEIAGDKSAYYEHMPLERLDASVGGDARFVHVIRDARDVCASWLRINVGPRSAPEAARLWSGHVAGKCAWGARNPSRYHEIRFEDLLDDPKATLEGACRFIGVPYSEALLEFHKGSFARDIANSTTHPRLSEPLDPRNKGRWRETLSGDEARAIEGIAHRELLACGYELSCPPGPGALAELGRAIGSHRARLALKNALPAFAIMAAWLHVPLERVCNHPFWLRTEGELSARPRRRDPAKRGA